MIRKGNKIDIEWTTYFLSDEGFHKIVLKNNYRINPKKYYMGISITINPIRLIDKENKLRLTNEKDIEEIEGSFNSIIKSISPYLDNFFNWKVERIDYTIDLKVKKVAEYIKLFQRSNNPYNFKMQYSKTGKERKQLKDSYYLISKSVTINFYDKEQQQRKQGYSEEEIAAAKNTLRFEVQIHKPKVYNIQNKHEFNSRELYHYLELHHSREQIIKYYCSTIGTGNYMKKDKAIRIINKSKYKENTKENLINILGLIAKKRSVVKAKEEFLINIKDEEELKKQKAIFSEYLRKIRVLGINPVTIPEDWKDSDLENLLGRLLDEFEREQNEI